MTFLSSATITIIPFFPRTFSVTDRPTLPQTPRVRQCPTSEPCAWGHIPSALSENEAVLIPNQLEAYIGVITFRIRCKKESPCTAIGGLTFFYEITKHSEELLNLGMRFLIFARLSWLALNSGLSRLNIAQSLIFDELNIKPMVSVL
ncbi:hypothetical protein CC78DRAFT_327942 [Lojkania enalia]|uniref:Uncharacterized protein n=1 Tax=Lojkania enalia TaxID=147567 RepID=A0A9P4K4J9_9PLEO|nr:hypothetical protein CC78DRAFT_327942 [Didymosphaeria enalia]